ncbi:MAG: response regulator, partial [Desulfobacterales bacterium]|nr:response regulator [Desulfobacterales bacterium]
MDGLLFIDDEEGIRRSMVRALRKESFKTYTVENGEKGIEFIRQTRSTISAVISDFKMPGLNGLETLAIIGRLNPEITRIILTGYATMETAIQATNEGIDGFLTKPFDNAEIRAKLHEIYIHKRLRQFVPEHVYHKIHCCPGALKPAFQQASILFTDIRGFTRLTEQVPPETLACFLNHDYFDPLGEIAYEHNGTLDKHIGDSMMVGFGTPVPLENDALSAVTAAIAMQRKTVEINDTLKNR